MMWFDVCTRVSHVLASRNHIPNFTRLFRETQGWARLRDDAHGTAMAMKLYYIQSDEHMIQVQLDVRDFRIPSILCAR